MIGAAKVDIAEAHCSARAGESKEWLFMTEGMEKAPVVAPLSPELAA